jgi:regulator of protease activity HflC (stomatin/prohibitin superfamily)
MQEKPIAPKSGGLGCVVLLLVLAGCVWSFFHVYQTAPKALAVVCGLVTIFMATGFVTLNPNETAVLQFFGAYVGTMKTDCNGGLYWVGPLYSVSKVSLRIQNFESAQLKVNDHDGNPIELGAIVTFRLRDTAQAIFAVSDYTSYLKFQTEAALRNLATRYPYDAHQEGQRSLRGDTSVVAEELKKEVQDHVGGTGLEIVDARISHLAYAPEIAAAMLQRQQANAMIAARQRIVEGAVGMVETAVQMLDKHQIVTLDAKQKSQMVGNLLVVLCSHSTVQPVLNAGTAKP